MSVEEQIDYLTSAVEQIEGILLDIKRTQEYGKYGMTVSEASDYFGIPADKIRQMCENDEYGCYYMWVDDQLIIKKPLFDFHISELNRIF